MNISVYDLAHSKGMPTAATEAMLLMQDRIEAQAAEIERLKREVMLQMGWKTEAQNEVERLREVLERIANGNTSGFPGIDEGINETFARELMACREVARAALGETK